MILLYFDCTSYGYKNWYSNVSLPETKLYWIHNFYFNLFNVFEAFWYIMCFKYSFANVTTILENKLLPWLMNGIEIYIMLQKVINQRPWMVLQYIKSQEKL